MGNPLKQLAGETAIYGLSTILARIINFLFVPFYTRLLTTSSYGVVTEFMAYIAVLQVVLVLGLETGCFRFANKEGVNPRAVYSNALGVVTGVSFSFLALMIVFSGQIASALGYAGFENCIIYVGGILALDCITAILFAKLRQEHKAFKFAIFKTVKILTETVANMVLFFWYP
uniref:lipopolysaccharide biosynthesis protein n=1 Tax=Candidatus Cryptobacteroides bacterium TaxID=3085639 RepID=UPI004025DE34